MNAHFGESTTIDGIAFRATGDGPMLVLVHGGSGSRTHWMRNVDALARRFCVVTIDMPGFGESAAPADGIARDDYLQWTARALDGFIGEASFDLAAFSFGTAAICGALARHARCTAQLRRLTLLSPTGLGAPPSRDLKLEKVPRPDGTNAQMIAEATARNLGRWMLAATPSPGSEAVSIHLDNVRRARYDSRQISLAETLIDDLAALAAVRTQVWIGERDALVWPSVAARLAHLREHAPHVVAGTIAGAGHWLAYDAAEPVNRAIASFHDG